MGMTTATSVTPHMRDMMKVGRVLRDVAAHIAAKNGLELKHVEHEPSTEELRGTFFSMKLKGSTSPVLSYRDKIVQAYVQPYEQDKLVFGISIDGPYVGAEIARMIRQDKCALERKIVDALRGTSDVCSVQVGDVTKKELIDYFTEITKF